MHTSAIRERGQDHSLSLCAEATEFSHQELQQKNSYLICYYLCSLVTYLKHWYLRVRVEVKKKEAAPGRLDVDSMHAAYGEQTTSVIFTWIYD
jgi:hypothetical protein